MWTTPNHDFGPRAGFAYDVLGDGRMSVRGGFAISYDRLFDNIWSNGAWNPPFYALLDHDATAGDVINYTASSVHRRLYSGRELSSRAYRFAPWTST